jgi:hypothetical protein
MWQLMSFARPAYLIWCGGLFKVMLKFMSRLIKRTLATSLMMAKKGGGGGRGMNLTYHFSFFLASSLEGVQ